MNGIIKDLAMHKGIAGLVIVVLFNYGFFTLLIDIAGLVTDYGKPIFGGSWGVLLFSCVMASMVFRHPTKE